MQAQDFLRGETGRYWVALSLREAESLRGAQAMRSALVEEAARRGSLLAEGRELVFACEVAEAKAKARTKEKEAGS